MRPPLKAVPMDPAPPSIREILQEQVEWLEYAHQLRKDDPESARMLTQGMLRLERVIERLRVWQARAEKSGECG